LTSESPETSPPSGRGRKRGCLFWTLVVGASLAVLVVVVGYFGYHYVFQGMADAYTDSAPLELAEPAMAPDDLGRLDGRIAAFAQAVRNKRPTAPLELTSEELTALLARSPDFRRMGGRARLRVTEGEVRADLSVPLDRMGYPNRWFNGTTTLRVALENGVLVITLQSASVRDRAVPQWVINRMSERNLAKDLYDKPEAAAFISRLESIQAKEGKLVIVARER
jgi:hypothetical protein